jgi:hypothetical protein
MVARRNKSKEELVRDAAVILRHTQEGRGSATDAMKLTGMDTSMRSDGAVKKAVYRKRKSLEEEQRKIMPPLPLPTTTETSDQRHSPWQQLQQTQQLPLQH